MAYSVRSLYGTEIHIEVANIPSIALAFPGDVMRIFTITESNSFLKLMPALCNSSVCWAMSPHFL